VIGDAVQVFVTVLGIDHGVVRLGIDAPPDLSVHREEVWNRIQDERRRPRSGDPPKRRH